MANANCYRRLLGKLIYLTVTRPDITYVFSVLSQFMHEPRMVHWEGALRVLSYIKRAPRKWLIYWRHDHLRIEAYSDAEYAGDKGDRKSTTRYCTYVGGNLVIGRSQKQKVVSCSSDEAEYRAMDDFSFFGNDFESCLAHMTKILEVCVKKWLVLSWEKSHFMVREGVVLGHIVSSKGLEVDKAKIEVIQNLPLPNIV